jgi:restriction endonuclease S subunit
MPTRTRPVGEVITGYTCFRDRDVLLAKITPCFENGKAGIAAGLKNGIAFGSTEFYVLRCTDKILPEFLYHIVKRQAFRDEGAENMAGTAGQQRVRRDFIEDYEIPLPPLEEQRRIVAEIEGYQKVLDGARQILDALEHQLHIEPDWERVPLGTICENLDGKRRPITKSDRKPGPYPYYGASGIVDSVADYIVDEPLLLVSEDGANLLARSTPIAFSVSGKIWVNNHAHVLRFPDMATQRFVEHYLNSISIANYVTGAAQPKLNQAQLNSIEIPLPPLPEQRRLVAELDAEAGQMDAVRALLPRFEAKIQRVLDRVWGNPPEATP